MPLRTYLTLDFSPYAINLYVLFLGMSAQTLACFMTCQQWSVNTRPRAAWLAMLCAMLFLLRQRWTAFEFSLATGVYDNLSAFCDLSVSIFLCVAIAGFAKAKPHNLPR